MSNEGSPLQNKVDVQTVFTAAAVIVVVVFCSTLSHGVLHDVLHAHDALQHRGCSSSTTDNADCVVAFFHCICICVCVSVLAFVLVFVLASAT